MSIWRCVCTYGDGGLKTLPNVVESELYFPLVCTYYSSLRSNYLGHVTLPSIEKFIAIMFSTNKKKLYTRAQYIKEGM